MVVNLSSVPYGPTIQVPLTFFELVPVIYLLIISMMDYQNGLVMRTHFLPVISELRDSIERYRKNSPTGPCPVIDDPQSHCPITASLELHYKTMYRGELETITDDLWAIIRKGFRLQNQATYFEIVVIQIFILFLATANWFIFFAAVAMFAFPYVGSTFIQKNTIVLFRQGSFKILGFGIPYGIWRIVFVIGLLGFSYLILTGL